MRFAIPLPLEGQLDQAARLGENLQDQVQQDQPLDIPTATGEDGTIDTAYDILFEQPSSVEDDRDLFGPSIGETTDALGVTDGLDPTQGDDGGLSGQSGVKTVAIGLAVLGVIVAVGQLFTVELGS
jgi:hypothetical protein